MSDAAGIAKADDVSVKRSRKRRRRRRQVMSLMNVLAVTFLTFGCTSTIRPPLDPVDPVVVFVLSEAMHTGIVLPPDPGSSGNPDQYVEFGFGDWSWFALANNSWHNAFSTMLWPTQGALGRRTFGARTAEQLRNRASWAKLQPILVSREKAAQLRRRLQAEFDSARKLVVVRQSLNFKFVPTEYSYWLLHNCADLAVDWLQELDCDAWWCPVSYDLLVEDEG
ncbi:MAG: hypothetical protein ACI8UD_002014 [Planctomycetota bacterium]|jgi:hypothetical protein